MPSATGCETSDDCGDRFCCPSGECADDLDECGEECIELMGVGCTRFPVLLTLPSKRLLPKNAFNDFFHLFCLYHICVDLYVRCRELY